MDISSTTIKNYLDWVIMQTSGKSTVMSRPLLVCRVGEVLVEHNLIHWQTENSYQSLTEV